MGIHAFHTLLYDKYAGSSVIMGKKKIVYANLTDYPVKSTTGGIPAGCASLLSGTGIGVLTNHLRMFYSTILILNALIFTFA